MSVTAWTSSGRHAHQKVGIRLEVCIKDGHVVIVHQQVHTLQQPCYPFLLTQATLVCHAVIPWIAVHMRGLIQKAPV